MDAWIPLTLTAALAQTLRFALQKSLGGSLSPVAATLARFLFSAPLVAALVLILARLGNEPLPLPGGRFWAFALTGGLMQILATLCVVMLFASRNFAVGITLKKSEVLLTAISGWFILGEGIGPAGALALGLGFGAVLVLSRRVRAPVADGAPARRRWRADPTILLGLASGFCFSISAVCYRGAALALPSGDVAMRAGLTLAVVTTAQSLAMLAWMGWRDRDGLVALLRAWRLAALVGLCSMIGSFCWFAAFTLQNAAYVNALGQVELVFSIAVSVLFFRERISAREWLGMALLLASVLILVGLA